MRPLYRDIAAALAPILAGFGLAAFVHKFDKRSVTKITHDTAKLV
jgi:hypothetical protein